MSNRNEEVYVTQDNVCNALFRFRSLQSSINFGSLAPQRPREICAEIAIGKNQLQRAMLSSSFPPILMDTNKRGIAATFQPFFTRVPNCAILTFLMYK